MAQTPRRRRLPKNITEKTDAEVAERLFGKPVKCELDKVAMAARRKSTTRS